MGFRFSKRISILPGVSINLSRSGASLSLGPRGASVTVGKRGVYGNVGLPGTGLSYRERLDRQSSGPREAVKPRLPDGLTARLVDDVIEFVDGAGLPIDQGMVPAARRALKDEIRAFLDQTAEVRNGVILLIRELHHDVPTGIGAIPRVHGSKPLRESYADDQSHVQAVMEWRAAAANSVPAKEAIEMALLAALGKLEWPYETNIGISLDDGRLLLDVDLPELEEMPMDRWAVDGVRLALLEKPIQQKERSGLYLDHVSSVIVRLLGHAMAVSHDIQTVGISGYTQRRASTGSLEDDYVATVEVGREAWREVDPASFGTVDPHNMLRRFAARIETNSRGMLLNQQPLI